MFVENGLVCHFPIKSLQSKQVQIVTKSQVSENFCSWNKCFFAVIMWLFRQQVLSYATHSPVTGAQSMENVLENLNLSSSITPQMVNRGLSQERKSTSHDWQLVYGHTARVNL